MIYRFLCTVLIILLFSLSTACSNEPQDLSDYDRAMVAKQSSNWVQVVNYLEMYFRDGTDNSSERRLNAWYVLIDALSITGQTDYALSCLDLMKEEYYKDAGIKLKILERQAYLLDRTGEIEKASSIWLEIINLEKIIGEEAAEIYKNLAFSYQKIGEYEKSDEMFIKCLQTTNDSSQKAECLYYLAETASTLHDWEKAKEYAIQAEQLNDIPSELQSLIFYLLGDIYFYEKNNEKAKEYFEKAQLFHPNKNLVLRRIEILE